MPKKVWLIDENENQLRTYARQIRRLLPSSIQVEQMPPFQEMAEYVELLADADTVCIILDQRLKDTGVASYTGIELAQFLRDINSILPIYILTNYPPDLHEEDIQNEYESGEWSVEDIIDKRTFRTAVGAQKFVARLTRRLAIYEEVVVSHASRFRELLRKKVVGELSDEEEREYEMLQFERLAPEEAMPDPQNRDLQQLIDLNRELLNSFTKRFEDPNNE